MTDEFKGRISTIGGRDPEPIKEPPAMVAPGEMLITPEIQEELRKRPTHYVRGHIDRPIGDEPKASAPGKLHVARAAAMIADEAVVALRGDVKRPAHYIQIPNDLACTCIHAWTESDGSNWCCNTMGTDGKSEGAHLHTAPDKSTPAKLHVIEGSKPATDEAQRKAGIEKHIADLTADFGRTPTVTEKLLIEHVAGVTELNATAIASGDINEIALASSMFLNAIDTYHEAKEPTVASMTMHDHIAIEAMKVAMAHGDSIHPKQFTEVVALASYNVADAMMLARRQGQS